MAKFRGRIEIGGTIYCFIDKVVQEFLDEIKPGPLFERWIRTRIRGCRGEKKYYWKNRDIELKRVQERRIMKKEILNEQSRAYYYANKDHLNTLQWYFRHNVSLVPIELARPKELPPKYVVCKDEI